MVLRIWRALLRSIRVKPGRSAVAVSVLMVAALLINALAFWWFDGQQDPGISFGDAVWYSLISITTIGYGDFSATTWPARLATAIAIVFIGLPVFGAFLGLIADRVVAHHEKERQGMLPVDERDHVLILNFPSAKRVQDIASEFRADAAHSQRSIFLVTDRVASNPLSEEAIGFVQGSPIDEDVLQRANIDQAATVIVLAPDYGSAESDSQVAAAVTLVEALKPEARTVAECLDERHRFLFASANTDAVIFPLRMANNAIVQVSQDPGVGKYLDQVLANSQAESLYSTVVPDGPWAGRTYLDLARYLLDQNVVMQAVMQGSEVTMNLGAETVQPGDRIIYYSRHRLSQEALLPGASD
ncbi:potassium channel family protein [Thiohalorhabdus sp.]|uniref:potassium channel family protein n=1 Tax=Thiohalorhabdus sp. TaxID=3094134 RepID=UPI002FC2B868